MRVSSFLPYKERHPRIARWQRVVGGLVQIVEGVAIIFLAPFGYLVDWWIMWIGYVLRSQRSQK